MSTAYRSGGASDPYAPVGRYLERPLTSLAALLVALAACHPPSKDLPGPAASAAHAAPPARASAALPAAPGDPFLQWRFEEKVSPEGMALCYPRAVAWIDGEDKPLWQRDLPPRMRASPWGACNEAELVEYRRDPRHRSQLLYAVIGVLTTGEAVVIADGTGLLALRREDGAPLLDRAAPPDAHSLFFDEGSFDFTTNPPCTGEARRGKVFARCGASLVYFNGTTALALDVAPLRVEAEATLTRSMILAEGVRTEAEIPIGARRLLLHGRTYMR